MQLVEIVEIHVRFHLSQDKTDPFIVMTVFLTTDQNEVIAEEADLVDVEAEDLVDVEPVDPAADGGGGDVLCSAAPGGGGRAPLWLVAVGLALAGFRGARRRRPAR